MHTLTATELLSVWERGRSQPPYRQALMLLAAAYPETQPEELAGLSIGRRDSLLLTLREWLFGLQLMNRADCPACAEKLELDFSVSDIRVDTGEERNHQLFLEMGGYEVLYRLPDSNDLAVLANNANGRTGRDTLLKRCLLEVRLNGIEHPAESLPTEIINGVTNQMSQADPQADVTLSLDCPCCGHHWLAVFDILSFLWTEIESWAQRILREVHILARSYGWREADILAMSALRRQTYLEMLAT